MIKCEIEFDNKIASPLSPQEFLKEYVFRGNVVSEEVIKNEDGSYNEKLKVYLEEKDENKLVEVMEIRIINAKQF